MMKALGIVRRVDELGRVVIPKEARKSRGIDSGSAVEFFTEGDFIYIRKVNLCEDYARQIDVMISYLQTDEKVEVAASDIQILEQARSIFTKLIDSLPKTEE